MRRFALLPALALAAAMVGLGRADPPDMQNPGVPPQAGGGLSNLIQPQAEPDINAGFAVTPEAGPWMICAASYQGPDAPELANKICQYLRDRRYAAYVYNRGNEERKQLQKELDDWRQQHPDTVRHWKLAHPQEEQLAVLIGGFRDGDAARSELKKVHKLDPPTIQLKSGKPGCDTYDVYEPVPGQKTYALKRYAINPFHTAMVVPNPTVRRPAKTTAPVDPLWKKLNADEPRSVFKCPKPWTLAVQEFRGTEVIQTASTSGGFLSKLGFGDQNLGKRLDCSAKMAEDLCDLFRRGGFKSYVLHTRFNSVVTVGEFDSRDDPALAHMQERLRAVKFQTKTGETPFKLFATALPMEVPR